MTRRMILNEVAYFGKGASEEVVHILKNRNFKKVLVVTQQELIELKVASKVTDLLDEAGIPY